LFKNTKIAFNVKGQGQMSPKSNLFWGNRAPIPTKLHQSLWSGFCHVFAQTCTDS